MGNNALVASGINLLVFKFQNGEVVVRVDTSKSPITATRLLNSIPIVAPYTRIGNLISIPVDLGSLPETYEVRVRRGELAYRPNVKQLVLAVEDTVLDSRVNPLGIVVFNLDLLNSLKSSIVTITAPGVKKGK